MGQGGMMQGGQMMGGQTQPGQMMGGQMSPGMMQGGQGGMMGHGMMGGMMQGGQGGMMGHGFGDRVVPSTHLSTDDVRHFLEHRLARRGNKRLKVGEVKEEGKDSIVADIVTVDDSLVERLKVDRHTGKIERVD